MSEQLGLDLDRRTWPTAPPAPAAEQYEAPLEGTIQEEYDRWRQTEPGILVWAFVQRKGRELSAAIPPAQRKKGALSIDWLVQLARKELRLSVNNDYRALLGRDLVAAHPSLADLIERRRRTTA